VSKKRFPAALKRARGKSDLSQKELARRVGLTGSYISQLESGARRPPRPAVVKKLCRAMGVREARMQELAALERSPAGIRQRIEKMDKERGLVRRSRDRLLSTTLFHMARRPGIVDPIGSFVDLSPPMRLLIGRLTDRHRAVGSLKEAEENAEDLLQEATAKDRNLLARVLPGVLAGPPPETETAGPSARQVAVYRDSRRTEESVDNLQVDARLGSAEAFLLRVENDEAHPRVEAGDLLLLDPNLDPHGGDLVVVSRESRDHVRTWHAQGGGIRLDGMRPEIAPLRMTPEEFDGTVVLLLLRALR
jgi:transcriptional regulator with XRE-family HTH domain